MLASKKLDWYDYGARMYDPALGRWHCQDAVIEFASPYVYCGNNPVRFIDPFGLYSGERTRYYLYGNEIPSELGEMALSTDAAEIESYVSGHGNPNMAGIMKVVNEWGGDAELTDEEKEFVKSLGGFFIKGVEHYRSTEYYFVDLSLAGSRLFPTKNGEAAWDRNGDGLLSLREANIWYRNAGDQDITVDASKLTFYNVDPNKLSRTEATSINFELRGPLNIGLVYGTLDLILVGNNKVFILSNDYDFNTGVAHGHPWFSAGFEGFLRNVGTVAGHIVARSGTDYTIHFTGFANLNYKPFEPVFHPSMKF